jgi:hypothetical protein
MRSVMALGTFALGLLVGALPLGTAQTLEQHNEVSYLRGPYNIEFFKRHFESFQISAALHFAHGKQHDVLLLTPIGNHDQEDRRFEAESLNFVYNPSRTEPKMEYFAPYTAQVAWTLFRAIDWTHMHHEQTYDIMAEQSIPWDRKKEYTDRAVRYYLDTLTFPAARRPWTSPCAGQG